MRELLHPVFSFRAESAPFGIKPVQGDQDTSQYPVTIPGAAVADCSVFDHVAQERVGRHPNLLGEQTKNPAAVALEMRSCVVSPVHPER